jgi:DNA invertase Pin-like site-specific DNA recombinase
MNAIGYVRVSSEGQAMDGVSLDAQQARIRAWCEGNGYVLVGLHVDAGLSGGRADNRPALQAALNEVCRQKGVLVVYSLSRLARSTRDTLLISDRLSKAGAHLASLSEKLDSTSAAGKMLFRLLAVLSEFERDVIAERTKGALGHMRNQGRRISGKIPYGYSLAPDGENLLPNPGEQGGLDMIRRLRAKGFGRRRIAAELTRRGIRTKIGGLWNDRVVGRIMGRMKVCQPVAPHVAA